MNPEWLVAALENIADGIIVIDYTGIVQYCNRAAFTLMGDHARTLLGSRLPLLNFDKPLEMRIAQIDGTMMEIEMRAAPILWGMRDGYILTVRDVTARKKCELAERQQRAFADALRETTARVNALTALSDLPDMLLTIFERIASVIPYDGVNIMLIDADDAYIISESGYETRGVRTTGGRLKIVDNWKFHHMRATGEPLIVADTYDEPSWVRFEGTDWVRGHASALIGAGKQVIGFLNLDSARVGAYTIDDAQRLQAFADQIGMALRSAKLLDDYARYTAQLEAMVEARTAQEREQHAQAEDGLRAALDVERAALAHQRRLNELIARFVSAVSHEFKTPLAAIMLAADFMKMYRTRLTPERIEEQVEAIQHEIYKLDALIEEILFARRAEEVGLEFMPHPVDLLTLATEVVSDARRVAASHHQIALIMPTPCVKAMLDGRLMQRALMNLLTNAIKYSPRGGAIELEIYCENMLITLRVRDHGIGIPMSALARIFETFYRAENAHGFSGTGLGLSIVKQVVDLHDGTIAVESEIGVGTTFIIQMPHVRVASAESHSNRPPRSKAQQR
jgi:signal transduction histidine kinase